MANRDFDEWLSKFRTSISSYDYYIDFEKVVRNVEESLKKKKGKQRSDLLRTVPSQLEANG